MKLKACGLAAAAVLIGGPAAAQSAQGLELGLETTAYNYKETFEGESIRDEGRFTGFTVEYGRAAGPVSFDARFRFGEGEIDYSADDGARLDDIQQTVGQLELLLGRPITLSPATTVTPYLGIAARVLIDESGGEVTDTGLSGYDREVSYGYVPLGAAVRFQREDGGVAVIHGQFNAIVSGEVRSDFGTIEPGAPEIVTPFDGGYGVELGARLQVPFRGHRISFGPVFRYWKLKRSESAVFTDPDLGEAIELFEPPNRTFELGLRLAYVF